jgi:hypothetical protein
MIHSLPEPFRISRLLANYRNQFFTLSTESGSIAPDPMKIVPLIEFGRPFRRLVTEELARSPYSPHVVIIGAECSGEFNSEWVEMIHLNQHTQFFREISTDHHGARSWQKRREVFAPRMSRLAEAFSRKLDQVKVNSDSETVRMGGSGATVYLADGGRLSEFHFDLSDWSFRDSTPQRWVRFFLTASRFSFRFWSWILQRFAL